MSFQYFALLQKRRIYHFCSFIHFLLQLTN